MKKIQLSAWFITLGIWILSAQKNTSELHPFATIFDTKTVETVNGEVNNPKH